MRGEARNTSHEQEQKSPPTTLASTLLEKKKRGEITLILKDSIVTQWISRLKDR